MNGRAARMTSALTAWLLIAVLVVIGVYDVYTILYGGPGESVSEYIHTLAQRFPVLPFLIGVLIGHLLWPANR